MRVAVLGAGGIGGLIGARLAKAGEEVTLVARGAHLAAMRAHGLRVVEPGDEFTVHPECSDSFESIRPAEVVFLTLKAHSLPALAETIARNLDPKAALVTAQNGIPWWYFQRHGGALDGRRLEAVDPGGRLATALDPGRLVGCVVYPATRLLEPGVVEHLEGNRLSLGELDGSRSERCADISAALTRAGFKAPIQTDIRTEIWVKLLGNAVLNPLSALTRATLADILGEERGRELVRAAMEEVAATAAATGINLPISIDRRLRGASEVGAHKTSMLQDLEAGRPMEIEAVVGAVAELAERLDVPCPRVRTLYAAVSLLGKQVSAPTSPAPAG